MVRASIEPEAPRRVGGLIGELSPAYDQLGETRVLARVSPTQLRIACLCPLQVWYAGRTPSETAAPTLGLAIGQIVHAVRARITALQFSRYVQAESEADLAREINQELKSLIESGFMSHYYISVFGERAEVARVEWTERLLSLERLRASRASRSWGEGLRGIRLARACCPTQTEVEWFDPALDMHGFCDELWTSGRFHRPVELKTSPHTPTHLRANRSQVAAYGYLASHVGELEVDYCEVEYLEDGYRDKFRYGKEWAGRVLQEARRVKRILTNQDPPTGTPSREVCAWCPFQSQCPQSLAPDVDTALRALDVYAEREMD